jgi:hypothetical protein
MEKLKIILEPSIHPHFTSSSGVTLVKKLDIMNTIVLETKGRMVVEHEEHPAVATSGKTKQVIKINQQEFNPVLQAMQNSFD